MSFLSKLKAFKATSSILNSTVFFRCPIFNMCSYSCGSCETLKERRLQKECWKDKLLFAFKKTQWLLAMENCCIIWSNFIFHGYDSCSGIRQAKLTIVAAQCSASCWKLLTLDKLLSVPQLAFITGMPLVMLQPSKGEEAATLPWQKTGLLHFLITNILTIQRSDWLQRPLQTFS